MESGGQCGPMRKKARNRISTCGRYSARRIWMRPWKWRSASISRASRKNRVSVPRPARRRQPDLPLDSARTLYDAVGSRHKTIKIFAGAEGGVEHIRLLTASRLNVAATHSFRSWMISGPDLLASRVKYHRESSAGEFHSHALAEPDVRLSPHTAPIMEPCRCTSCQ